MGDLNRPREPASVYRNIVQRYVLETGISTKMKKPLRIRAVTVKKEQTVKHFRTGNAL